MLVYIKVSFTGCNVLSWVLLHNRKAAVKTRTFLCRRLTLVLTRFIILMYSKVSRDTLYEAVKEVLQGSVAKPRKWVQRVEPDKFSKC